MGWIDGIDEADGMPACGKGCDYGEHAVVVAWGVPKIVAVGAKNSAVLAVGVNDVDSVEQIPQTVCSANAQLARLDDARGCRPILCDRLHPVGNEHDERAAQRKHQEEDGGTPGSAIAHFYLWIRSYRLAAGEGLGPRDVAA